MGDRCWLELTIRGEINTPRALVRIAKAIIAEGLTDSVDVEGSHKASDHQRLLLVAVLDVFFEASEAGYNPSFTGGDVNWANIDNLEHVLCTFEVDWHVRHDAGAEYGKGVRSWSREHGHNSCCFDDEPLLQVSAVQQVINVCRQSGEDPVYHIEQLVESALRANGWGLLTFSISESVSRFLAKLQAAKALQLIRT